MSHEIMETDRYGEVRTTGHRAWHRLGVSIEEGLSAEEALPRIGLGWETELFPLYVLDPHKQRQLAANPNGWNRPFEDSCSPVETHFAQVRLDTRKILGVVGKDYRPIQNTELARFADALGLADARVTVETAGSLHNGRKVFVLLRLPAKVRALAEDVLEQYLLVWTGHGGAAGFNAHPTSIRVCCANTLRWSERDATKGVRFSHTGDLEAKLKLARTTIGLAIQETRDFEAKVKWLAGSSLNAVEVQYQLRTLWVDLFGSPTSPHLEPEAREKLRAKFEKDTNQWAENHEKDPYATGTSWGVYNAVSYWHDHQRGRLKDGSDARMGSNVFGASQADKRRAFEKVLVLAR